MFSTIKSVKQVLDKACIDGKTEKLKTLLDKIKNHEDQITAKKEFDALLIRAIRSKGEKKSNSIQLLLKYDANPNCGFLEALQCESYSLAIDCFEFSVKKDPHDVFYEKTEKDWVNYFWECKKTVLTFDDFMDDFYNDYLEKERKKHIEKDCVSYFWECKKRMLPKDIDKNELEKKHQEYKEMKADRYITLSSYDILQILQEYTDSKGMLFEKLIELVENNKKKIKKIDAAVQSVGQQSILLLSHNNSISSRFNRK